MSNEENTMTNEAKLKATRTCPDFRWQGIFHPKDTAHLVTLWPGSLGQRCFYGASREEAAGKALAFLAKKGSN